MFAVPPGLVALYKHDKPAHHTDLPIVAFDDDGHPLVIDADGKRDKTRLIRADAYSNYNGMAEDEHPPLTALLPAGGWRIEYIHSEGGTWSEPLVGWGLKGGAVVPLAADCTGIVDDFDHYSGEYRIYHPDATTPAGEATERDQDSHDAP